MGAMSRKKKVIETIPIETIIDLNKREIIRKRYRLPDKPVPLDAEHLKENIFLKVVLSAVFNAETSIFKSVKDNACMIENNGRLVSLANINEKIVPRFNMPDFILFLVEKNMLSVSPESKESAFTFIDDRISSFEAYSVDFYVNCTSIEELFSTAFDNLINENMNVANEIHEIVSIAECLEYLYFNIHKIYSQFHAGSKTISLLTRMLEHYSVEQVYSLIFRGIKNAVHYGHINNMYSKMIASLCIAKIESLFEITIKNDWEISPYNRTPECSKSILRNLVDDFFSSDI